MWYVGLSCYKFHITAFIYRSSIHENICLTNEPLSNILPELYQTKQNIHLQFCQVVFPQLYLVFFLFIVHFLQHQVTENILYYW